jgi:hypothetical protein
MKNIVYLFIAGAISVSAVGCGNGGDKSSGKDQEKVLPGNDQKAQLQSVQASIGRAQSAIPAGNPMSPSIAVVQGSATAALAGSPRELFQALISSSITNAGGDEARIEMQNKLQDSVDSGECKVTRTGLEGATSGSVDPMSGLSGALVVNGSGCPVSFSLRLASSMISGSSISISFLMEYSVSDEAYRRLNDVDSISMALRFDVSGNDSNATIVATIDGKVHSQQFGNVTETARGNGSADRNGGRFQMNVVDTFPGFAIARGTGFTVDRSGRKTFTYAVNGNAVTQAEFDSYGKVAVQ